MTNGAARRPESEAPIVEKVSAPISVFGGLVDDLIEGREDIIRELNLWILEERREFWWWRNRSLPQEFVLERPVNTYNDQYLVDNTPFFYKNHAYAKNVRGSNFWKNKNMLRT